MRIMGEIFGLLAVRGAENSQDMPPRELISGSIPGIEEKGRSAMVGKVEGEAISKTII
jgi:hypothetical protein